jgi:hypothetical protein
MLAILRFRASKPGAKGFRPRLAARLRDRSPPHASITCAGIGEKYWSLSGFPSHSLESGGGAFLTIIFGQIFAYSAFSDSHFSSPGSVDLREIVRKGLIHTSASPHGVSEPLHDPTEIDPRTAEDQSRAARDAGRGRAQYCTAARTKAPS